MDKFKVGEVAIYQHLTISLKSNGEECEIIRGLDYHEDSEFPHKLMYITKDANGIFVVKPENLRKKNPPQELSTWEEVQKLTNWNPSKEVSHG